MKKSERGDLYRSESDGTFAMKRRRFTNTALPVFSGAECWFQHFHIVQAIVKSNGWSEETAALQLFAHLKGESPCPRRAPMGHVEVGHRWERVAMDLLDMSSHGGLLLQVDKSMPVARQDPLGGRCIFQPSGMSLRHANRYPF